MQHKSESYNPEFHDKYKALTVKLPCAHYISIGAKPFEIRKKKTKFRGDVVICSSQTPVINTMIPGATLCIVTIVDCVRVTELTDKEWKSTFITEPRENFSDQYAYVLENPRRVIELPVKGNLGFWNLILDKDELMEYPTELYKVLDKYSSKKQSLEKSKIRVNRMKLLGFGIMLAGALLFSYIVYLFVDLLI